MIFPILFIVSGVGIFVLIVTKMRQFSTKRDPLLLRFISLGDAHVRELSQRGAHLYADTKDELEFFFRKQLPLRAKSLWNKILTSLSVHGRVLMSDLQGTRLFKKNGDISEFFKAVTEKENETIEIEAAERDLEDSQNGKNGLE
jgi:hypothetical protein